MNRPHPSAPSRHRIAIALGGNIGDTAGHFQAAVQLLRNGGVNDIRQAPLYLTTPVDCEPGTPDFVNSAITATWAGTPEGLLALCQGIERQLGRPRRHSRRESRLIDLDLLLFDSQHIDLPDLVIPHPRLRQRRFVLEPLAQIAPEWPVPPDGQTVQQLLSRLIDSH